MRYQKIERKCSHRFPTATERKDIERDLTRLVLNELRELPLYAEQYALLDAAERITKTVVRTVASYYERDQGRDVTGR